MHRSAVLAAIFSLCVLVGCSGGTDDHGHTDFAKALSPMELGYRWSQEPEAGATVTLEAEATCYAHAEHFELVLEAEGMDVPEDAKWVGTIYEGKTASFLTSFTIPEEGPVKIWLRASLHGEGGAELTETGTLFELAGPQAAQKATEAVGKVEENSEGEKIITYPANRRDEGQE